MLNSAEVHVRGGTFQGEMKAERRGQLKFYGCFTKIGRRVSGTFPDESKLDVTVRTLYGGEVILIPVSEQECETAPSTSPTNYPTVSPQPTIPQPNDGRTRTFSFAMFFASIILISIKIS